MSFDYLSLEKLPGIRRAVNWIDFELKTDELKYFEIFHGSALHNNFSLFFLIIVYVIIVWIITWVFKLMKNQHNSSYATAIAVYGKFFKYGILIRICIEWYLYITLTSIEEIRKIDIGSLSRKVSYSSAFVLWILIIAFTLISIYKWRALKNNKDIEKLSKDRFEELFIGLKNTHASRFYTPRFLTKRLLFTVIILLFFDLSVLI